jgi:hypothetical protein
MTRRNTINRTRGDALRVLGVNYGQGFRLRGHRIHERRAFH